MRRRLSLQQIEALIVRLSEMKIRSGIITTNLWQLGWIVPPFRWSPVRTYIYYVLWLGLVGIANSVNLTFGVHYFAGSYLSYVSPLLLPGLILVLQFKSRRRLQALLVAIFAVGISLFGIGLAGIMMLTPRIVELPNFASSLRDAVLEPILIIGAVSLIVLPGVFSRRGRRPATRWEDLVEDVVTRDAF